MTTTIGRTSCVNFLLLPPRLLVGMVSSPGCLDGTLLVSEKASFPNLQGLSLSDLLGLSDTDVLWNISYDACITISELKQKLVGIYLCSDCISLRKVREVHEECRQIKYELEIVVVCCPFYNPLPPMLRMELIIGALARLKVLGWWVFPFDNTVCHRLHRERMCEVDSNEEDLFIVDLIEKYVDPYGLPIIRDFGMECYPFTRRNLVEKELQRITGLRLNSLLLPWTHVSATLVEYIHIFDFSTALLKNKIVVLYLYKEKEKFLADKLTAWYEKNIKRKHSNVVKVVAVSIDGGGTSDKYFMDKGWLVCPAHHPCQLNFVMNTSILSVGHTRLLLHLVKMNGADIKLEIIQRMEVERDVDLFAADDECGGSDLKSESNLMRHCPSTSYKALSDRTLKRLAEEACFPNVSECRLKQIKASISGFEFKDTFDRPDTHALSKEYKIGSYFETEYPVYSESFLHVLNVEVGKQLNVLELLGDNLLSFSQNISQLSAHRIRSVYLTALASHELARRDDFVLVVVPMMRKGFTHSLSAYQQFLLGFSCLAVPFEDCDRRERNCLALGFDGLPTVAILDPSQEDASISISELKKKFVGIYLCSECYSLRKLQEVDEECRRKKYELEIVVVCCPFDMGVPPKLFEGLIMDQLASLNLLGWRSLVEKEFQRLRGLSLSSLLLPWTYVCRKDELGSSSITQKPVEEALNYKIVLLYLCTEKEKDLADKLAVLKEGYEKREHSNVVEVVAVSIDDPSKSAKLCEEFFLLRGGTHQAVVAFGEDGLIQSMDACQLLECQGGAPSHDNLHKEVAREFENDWFPYMQGTMAPLCGEVFA
ncbi:unnamed protein product [Cuscuta campestris]|uniref:FBD domain-containing protein n=1 Tax=Cuscuta campestris TaxID=132261 RepID=A0A484NN54_9ASTE|nr:unnamed protein product [Cuscuta campestris]